MFRELDSLSDELQELKHIGGVYVCKYVCINLFNPVGHESLNIGRKSELLQSDGTSQ